MIQAVIFFAAILTLAIAVLAVIYGVVPDVPPPVTPSPMVGSCRAHVFVAERSRDADRIKADSTPPCRFIAVTMQLAMMSPA